MIRTIKRNIHKLDALYDASQHYFEKITALDAKIQQLSNDIKTNNIKKDHIILNQATRIEILEYQIQHINKKISKIDDMIKPADPAPGLCHVVYDYKNSGNAKLVPIIPKKQ